MPNIIIAFKTAGELFLYLYMKKILALNNIETIYSVYADLTSRETAYTLKLLELGVIIDFRGVPIVNQKDFREETHVFASIHRDGIFYQYTLFSTDEILGPLVITRLIIDAVNYIETCNSENIIEELKEISTGYSVVNKNADEDINIYNIIFNEYFDAINMIKKSLEI